MEMKNLFPIEVTTHNLYFHEEASIFTIDTNGNYIATGGGDKEIRLWTYSKENFKKEDFYYTTAINTSVKIKYNNILSGHQKTVNCLRFNGELLASCSDGGEVIIWNNQKPNIIRRLDGDDAYELVWGADHLFVGFSSGNISVFKILRTEDSTVKSDQTIEKTAEVDIKLKSNKKRIEPTIIEKVEKSITITAIEIQKIKAHNDIVQGLAYNNTYNTLTSLSKDRTGKTWLFSDKLIQIEKMEFLNKDKLFSAGRGFFRRLSYSPDGKFLYLASCLSNSVIVLHYPFRTEHIYAKIGPFDSEPLKIICDKEKLYIVTKRSLYLFINNVQMFCVENMSYMSITDGCIADDICILSSLDGFLSSLRIKH